MSKQFIANVIRDSTSIGGTAANAVTGDLIQAIVREMKTRKGFTLTGFGTSTVGKTRARFNPRTGEPIKVKAGKTVRFRASLTLRNVV